MVDCKIILIKGMNARGEIGTFPCNFVEEQQIHIDWHKISFLSNRT
jgi:hypothetical protein